MAQKFEKGVTPAGSLAWATLSKPSTKFKKDGEYSVKLVLDAAAGADFIAKLKPLADAARAEIIANEKDAKKVALLKRYTLAIPGTVELDDAANETGNIVFSFRQTAVITPKDASKPPFQVKIGVFDAKGTAIPESTRIGRGSIAKVAYEVIPFKMASDATSGKIGISLRLKAVQILTLKEFTTGTADSFGFGEEQGYVQDFPAESPAANDAAAPEPANVDF